MIFLTYNKGIYEINPYKFGSCGPMMVFMNLASKLDLLYLSTPHMSFSKQLVPPYNGHPFPPLDVRAFFPFDKVHLGFA